MITFFILFFIVFLFNLKPKDSFFITLFALLAFNGVLIDKFSKHNISVEKEFIYTLSNSNPQINGSFFIGSGNIQSTPQYSYFVKNEDGSKEKKYIPAKKTKIFEDTNEKPYRKTSICKDGFSYTSKSWLTAVPHTHKKCENFKNKNGSNVLNELHVPANTIVQEFKL